MTLLDEPSGQDPVLAAAVKQHRSAILRYFRRRVRRYEIAEELTQDTLVRATASWSTYDPARSKPKTWLFGIASHVLADHYERNTKVAAAEEAWAATEPRDVRELAVALPGQYAAAFRSLSEADRQILSLIVLRDLSPEVVAHMLGISRSGASNRAIRALRRLEEKVKEE